MYLIRHMSNSAIRPGLFLRFYSNITNGKNADNGEKLNL